MIAFIDSSVLLRKLFGEPEALARWSAIEEAYASRLLPLEVGRVIDRCRLAGDIDDEQLVALLEECRRVAGSIEILSITESILQRAAGPMPTLVGSLDAIHLITALELSSSLEEPVVFATHDEQLARAARACGLKVIGAQ